MWHRVGLRVCHPDTIAPAARPFAGLRAPGSMASWAGCAPSCWSIVFSPWAPAIWNHWDIEDSHIGISSCAGTWSTGAPRSQPVLSQTRVRLSVVKELRVELREWLIVNKLVCIGFPMPHCLQLSKRNHTLHSPYLCFCKYIIKSHLLSAWHCPICFNFINLFNSRSCLTTYVPLSPPFFT